LRSGGRRRSARRNRVLQLAFGSRLRAPFTAPASLQASRWAGQARLRPSRSIGLFGAWIGGCDVRMYSGPIKHALAVAFGFAGAGSPQGPRGAVQFTAHEIATGLRGGYQVVVADMNKDGKPDVIALASGLPELVWYENPAWQRHVIATG